MSHPGSSAEHPTRSRAQHIAHWGMFTAEGRDGEVVEVRPDAADVDPSPILNNMPGSVTHRSRIRRPAVRWGWLEDGPGATERRGRDEFVEMDWEPFTDLLAGELRRVIQQHGNESIYGSSYGWSSPGRFHHAQSQIHRFLKLIGGYTRSVNSYSLGASPVVLPHVIGTHWKLFSRSTSWDVIARCADTMVCFGGVPLKNTAVNDGGTSQHPARSALDRFRARGGRVVSVSPLADDTHGEAQRITPVPGTDVALMLAVAHTLVTEGLHDRDFLDRYCVGYPRFERYLLGLDDGQPKSPQWAASITEVDLETMINLARRMADGRTMINVSWSLQRVRGGEQTPWMGVTLAAMLGQIGLPGGGFGHGYGSLNESGLAPVPYPLPTFAQGNNPIDQFIPVARIADMLLEPGGTYEYAGQQRTYPDIRLVYWAGGNPFHHHQDLNRFRRAIGRPDTIVVHDPYWTPMAKHADFVVPSTTSMERNDLSATRNDPLLVAMQAVVPVFADARDDYDTFAELAGKLGLRDRFTEGRSSEEWLRHLYDQWRGFQIADGVAAPVFDDFWEQGSFRMRTEDDLVLFEEFRKDPEANPLTTASGLIEIFSENIANFGHADCPGHPVWVEPTEWLHGARAQEFPLHLIANQPKTRLHSQLDHGATSQASKIRGREPIRLHPDDAAARGIADGDIVKVFNDRGACLAGAVLDEGLRPHVVQLSTGAWYDPLDPADPSTICVHGNPNVLTPDIGTSTMAQGCTGQHVLVQIERYDGELPPIRAYDPPTFVSVS